MKTERLWRRNVLMSVVGVLLSAATCLAAEPAAKPEAESKPENRWESRIRAFEERDRESPPSPGGILFIGSSSIVGWDVGKSFPDLPVINRGFGGSQVADSVEFADRIAIPYAPRTIVFYAGDNDVASGKTPEQVAADYRDFVEKIHRALPKTRIVYIAIKPSLKRWNLVEQMRRANALIREAAEKDERLEFVDVDAPMIGEDGRPREELFRPDGLHLNAAGYELWTRLLRPHLDGDADR